MITLHHDHDQFAPFFIESILRFQKEHRHPKGIAVSLDEKEKQISIHFKLNADIDKSNPVCDQFEFKKYSSTGSSIWFCQFIGRVQQPVERVLSFEERKSNELANKLARPKVIISFQRIHL